MLVVYCHSSKMPRKDYRKSLWLINLSCLDWLSGNIVINMKYPGLPSIKLWETLNRTKLNFIFVNVNCLQHGYQCCFALQAGVFSHNISFYVVVFLIVYYGHWLLEPNQSERVLSYWHVNVNKKLNAQMKKKTVWSSTYTYIKAKIHCEIQTYQNNASWDLNHAANHFGINN